MKLHIYLEDGTVSEHTYKSEREVDESIGKMVRSGCSVQDKNPAIESVFYPYHRILKIVVIKAES